MSKNKPDQGSTVMEKDSGSVGYDASKITVLEGLEAAEPDRHVADLEQVAHRDSPVFTVSISTVAS